MLIADSTICTLVALDDIVPELERTVLFSTAQRDLVSPQGSSENRSDGSGPVGAHLRDGGQLPVPGQCWCGDADAAELPELRAAAAHLHDRAQHPQRSGDADTRGRVSVSRYLTDVVRKKEFSFPLDGSTGDQNIIRILRTKWWKYLIMGVADVEANYTVVKAYQFTSLTSIQVMFIIIVI